MGLSFETKKLNILPFDKRLEYLWNIGPQHSPNKLRKSYVYDV